MELLKPCLFLASLLIVGLAIWHACLARSARQWFDWRIGGVVVLVFLGFLAPSAYLFYATIFVIVGVLPRSRAQAAGMFIATTFMLPFASRPVFFGEIRFIDLTVVVCGSMGLLAALRLPRGPLPRARGPIAIDIGVLGLFFAEMILAVRVYDVSTTSVLRAIATFVVTLGVPYVFVSRLTGEENGLRRILHGFAMTGLAMAVVATFEMLRHWPLYGGMAHKLGEASGMSRTLLLRAGLLRSSGPFDESTGFGLFLGVTATIIAANRGLFRSREHYLAVVGIACLGLIAPLARSGWAGAAFGFMLIGLYRGKAVRTVLIAGCAAAAFGVALVALPETSTVSNVIGGAGHAQSTTTYREDLLHYSIPLIKAHPFFGVSVLETAKVMRSVLRSGRLAVDWVNTYLYFAVCTGLVGLAAFLILVLSPLVVAWRSRVRARLSQVDLDTAASLFAASGAFAVMMAGTSYAERMPLVGVLLAAMVYNLRARFAAGTRAGALDGPALGSAVAGRGPLVIDPARPVWTPPSIGGVIARPQSPALVR